jgi:hypothetical protein
MGMCEPWDHGAIIVLEEVWRGKPWSARPVRVVEDRPDLIALWCPEGTPVKGPVAPWRSIARSAGPAYFVSMLTHQDWIFDDFVWPTSNLMLLRPGDWHAVWVSWSRTGDNMGWYINFQQPFRRTKRGIQTMDLMLDLIVDQDRSWKWKDEDEFKALVGPGIIGEVEARHVRDEANAVLDRLERNDHPFCDPWHNWRPDPSWTMPVLPDDWNSVLEPL